MEKIYRQDIENEELFVDDTVEVVREEEERINNSDYNFCSVGKQGKVVEMGFCIHGVNVEFQTSQGLRKIECSMKNLKKIS